MNGTVMTSMRRSESLIEFAKAFTKAQAAIKGAKKDSENPHFRSKYADLASVREACHEALTANGLSVLQCPRLVAGTDLGWLIEVETTILHVSGEYVADILAMPVSKADAHGVGSAITYARRYALSSMAGIAPEDDDGEGAVARGSQPERATVARKVQAPPAGYDEWRDVLQAEATGSLAALEKFWKASRNDYRERMTQFDGPAWTALKARAGKVPA